MKELFNCVKFLVLGLLLAILLTLIVGCQQIDSVIDYFVELSVNTTTGDTDTEFSFEVSTNDTIIGIYDGDTELKTSRSAYSFTFSEGTHDISVVTENGATDDLQIVVYEPEEVVVVEEVIEYATRFVINSTILDSGETGSVVTLNGSILTVNGSEYDIDTMTPDTTGEAVQVVYSGTEKLIYIDMDIEYGTDSFLFRNDNMFQVFDFGLDELSVDNFIEFLDYINYIEPIPDFSIVLFNITCNEGEQDILYADDSSYLLNNVETSYIDAEGTQEGDTKTIPISISISSEDTFLTRNGNLEAFFDLSLSGLTMGELNLVMDIFYEHEGSSNLLDVVYKYNPDCELLVTYGYFD